MIIAKLMLKLTRRSRIKHCIWQEKVSYFSCGPFEKMRGQGVTKNSIIRIQKGKYFVKSNMFDDNNNWLNNN